ncbi:WXG100 family type VII secretion target [Micromonospora sp. NPDC049051]|uniref:WXG100 family type VII secretion target n=1 Tax=unclassified Micromonospora TaxID=2617518 RepID=UPI003723B0E6
MAGIVRYEFDTIDDCARAMINAIGQVRNELDGLRRRLDGSLADWDGTGLAAYQETKTIWDGAEVKMSEIAQEIAIRVQRANANMRETEDGVSKNFQNASIRA